MTPRNARRRVRLAWARVLVAGALGSTAPAAPALAADAPAWLTAAARTEASALAAKASAVVLHDEVQVTVGADGRIVTRRNYAVRVLTQDGRDAAAIREVYSTSGGQVRALRGWIISDGRSAELGRADTVDLALVDNDVYNEARVRVLAAGRTAAPGVVFGAESEVVERTVFTQLEWTLQDRWPVRVARRVLTLPPGGTARSVTLNAAPIAPVREGASYVWAVRDLPGVSAEPAAPPLSAVLARIAVTYDLGQQRDTAFETWTSVANWLDTLMAPQAAATPELVAKARALTAGATTDLDRVRAIGRYAQQVQYISVQTGLGRGGGYRPHAAADVLMKNYGDCKDKANLMKALLSTLGIRAYVVAIYSGDPDYVRAEWPSPQQFNHAIVAVALPTPPPQPASFSHSALGSLLFFDPTDEFTPVGELPRYLQGSPALVVTHDGGLIRMPTSKPEDHARVRRIGGAIGEEGGLSATVQYVTAGEPASIERRVFRSMSQDDYAKRLERELRSQVPGARLALERVGDDQATNRFELSLKVEAAAFAQQVNRLLLVKPPELAHLDLPEVGGDGRAQPVQLEFAEVRDIFDVAVPATMMVDELPEARSGSAAFGNFTVRWQVVEGRVVRSVALRITRATVLAAEAGAVRTFIAAFREAERAPVVLAPRIR